MVSSGRGGAQGRGAQGRGAQGRGAHFKLSLLLDIAATVGSSDSIMSAAILRKALRWALPSVSSLAWVK